jgi:hypothetical protein
MMLMMAMAMMVQQDWQRLGAVPATGAGAGLVASGDALFLTRGGGSPEFWRYSIPTHQWDLRAPLPFVAGDTGALAVDGAVLWALADSHLCRYDIDLDTWVDKGSTPAPCLPGAGLGIVNERVVILRGSNSPEMWEFDGVELAAGVGRFSQGYESHGVLTCPYYNQLYVLETTESGHGATYAPWVLVDPLGMKVGPGSTITFSSGRIHVILGGTTSGVALSPGGPVEPWVTLPAIARPGTVVVARNGEFYLVIDGTLFSLITPPPPPAGGSPGNRCASAAGGFSAWMMMMLPLVLLAAMRR